MISFSRLRAILSAWIGSDWPSYYTLIDTMTAYQCQQTAAILHDIARSMELSQADKVAATRAVAFRVPSGRRQEDDDDQVDDLAD